MNALDQKYSIEGIIGRSWGWIVAVVCIHGLLYMGSHHVPPAVMLIQVLFPFVVFTLPAIVVHQFNLKLDRVTSVGLLFLLVIVWVACFSMFSLSTKDFPPVDTEPDDYFRIEAYRVSVGLVSVSFWVAIFIAWRLMSARRHKEAEQVAADC